jgi:hypothetical protein
MPAIPTPPPAINPEAQSRRAWGCLFPIVLTVLLFSVLLNLATMLIYFGAIDNPLETDPNALEEHVYLGDRDA